MVKHDLEARFKKDAKYGQHVRNDVPGSDVKKYGSRGCTSSKGTFVKASDYLGGGGLDALLNGGWMRGTILASSILDSRYTARLAKRGASMKEYTIRPAFLPSVAAIKSFARSDTDAIIERPSEFLALKVGRRCKSPASFHPATGYAVEHGLVAGRAFGKAVARSS
jgi:hypothetical protein